MIWLHLPSDFPQRPWESVQSHHFLLPSLFSLVPGCPPCPSQLPPPLGQDNPDGLEDLGSIAQEAAFSQFTYNTGFQSCLQAFGYHI